ncbi:MAG TPA: hypothetical protein VGM82_24615 [Gemmatimonadaceae bacterium]
MTIKTTTTIANSSALLAIKPTTLRSRMRRLGIANPHADRGT